MLRKVTFSGFVPVHLACLQENREHTHTKFCLLCSYCCQINFSMATLSYVVILILLHTHTTLGEARWMLSLLPLLFLLLCCQPKRRTRTWIRLFKSPTPRQQDEPADLTVCWKAVCFNLYRTSRVNFYPHMYWILNFRHEINDFVNNLSAHTVTEERVLSSLIQKKVNSEQSWKILSVIVS